MRAWDAGLSSPGEPHSQSFGHEPVASFNIELGAEWLDRLRELGGILDQPVECRAGRVTRLVLQLFQEFISADTDSSLSIERIVLEIFAAYIGKQSTAVDSRRPDWLRRACNNLDSCLDKSLSRCRLAQSAGVHPIYFAEVFRRFNGCWVGKYMRRRRIECARRLLANPGSVSAAMTSGTDLQTVEIHRTHRPCAQT